MKAQLSIAVGMLLTAGCVQVVPQSGARPSGPCDATGAQSLIGRSATSELASEALSRTGAKALRWIQPGQAVTMDFREDRLNIELDGGNRIVRISCG